MDLGPTFVHCLDKRGVVDVLAVGLLELAAENLEIFLAHVQGQEVEDAAELVLGDIPSVSLALQRKA